jgi:DNA-binding MarR family transcriptional regulator
MTIDSSSRIRDEIKQSKPFRSAGHEVGVALLRTADVLRRRMSVALEPHGLSPQQYNVLRILRGAKPDGLPTLEIAERLVEQTPGITRLCDGLAKKGWLVRANHPSDRRVVLCRLTRNGERLLNQLDHVVSELEERVVEGLGKSQVQELLRMLERIRDNGT